MTTAITIRPQSTERINPDLRRATPAGLPAHARNTICLVGADAVHVDYAEVCSIPIPETTTRTTKKGNEVTSYRAVPFATFIDGARDFMADVLDAQPLYESYALSGKPGRDKYGQQLFGRMAFPCDIVGGTLDLVLRSSYDGTITNEIGTGGGEFICANGMISAANLIKVKHTHNVIETLRACMEDLTVGLEAKIEAARERLEWAQGLKEIPMSDDLFGMFCGLLQFRRHMKKDGTPSNTPLLTPHKVSAAMNYWRACHAGDLHQEHGQHDLFSAYQALTGANHRATPREAFASFAAIDFMTDQVSRSGGSVDGINIPEFKFEIEEYRA